MAEYIVNNVLGQANDMDMLEVYASKEKFETSAKAALDEKFSGYGYSIINVLIDDPEPSDDVVVAFNRVIATKREQEAAGNEAATLRIKEVGRANAEADSLKIKANAFVAFRNKTAQGNSEAIKLFMAGLEGGLKPLDVIRFFEGMDRRDAIRDTAQFGNVILLDVNEQSQIASVFAAVQAQAKYVAKATQE